ncbi:bacteriohemerythrin [Anaeromyxobacter oryzae]|uniref:Hemerythrin n=1 Tax=Anaeromyxobacter oryzae TaxID=2918170 RepID=A0ABN6MVD2_9BACT|nr:bacteriohemerythrin [Anaeromyxobacter oryzae]BDG04225.1 hemerythrin [Anaeromyxobacter oryzae]
MALRWTSELSVGVPEIDVQHEELFERVDALESAILRRDRAAAVRVLRFLLEYVRLHFAAEEALMAAFAYPARAAHEAEHAGFARTIEDLARVLDAEGATAALVHRMEREVSSWLRDHVFSTDLALGWYVRERRGAEVMR